MSSSPNRFGRQGGRGLRPWILLPKVIFVGLYLGSLAAALFGWTSSGFGALNKADPRRLWLLQQLSHLMLYVVVPCLLLALALGVALLLQHQRVLLRMRWLLVKLASLAILIPSAHLFARSRLTHLREAFAHQTTNDPAARQLAWCLAVTLLASIWVIILGRLKPRLGQNWARAYPAAVRPADAPPPPQDP